MPKLYTGEPDMTCPYRGGKLCSKVCPTCNFQTEVLGTNPNTGEPLARWMCALLLQHMLTLETNARTAGVREAIEIMRDEVTTQNRAALGGSVKLAERIIANLPPADAIATKQIPSGGQG